MAKLWRGIAEEDEHEDENQNENENKNEDGSVEMQMNLKTQLVGDQTTVPSSSRGRSEAHGPVLQNFPPHVLSVAPLNSVPYVGPPLPYPSTAPLPSEVDRESVEHDEPAIVYLPCVPTEQEWDKILSATKHGILLTGSAAQGMLGPILGLRDVTESKDSYLIHVSLPGVARDENKFNLNIEPDGKVVINGVLTTGEKIVHKDSMTFEMQTQNLGPPGDFSLSFCLPGPVDNKKVISVLENGILEAVVKKRKKTKASKKRTAK